MTVLKKKLAEPSNFPLGSQWRRWDLHVHTPDSKLGSSFPGVSWDEYVDALESRAIESDISVIGITDYMSIDGYERIFARISDDETPRLRTVAMVLPNIEFRTTPQTRNGNALNIHILVDPSQSDHVVQIKKALRNLQIEYTSNGFRRRYGCIRDDLIEFARAQDSSLVDDEAAYKFGIEQFKPSTSDLIEWFRNESWLHEYGFLGVSNGKDGISGLPVDGFSAVRDEILKNSHFVFSGNPNDREYYLGKKAGTTESKIREMYGTVKPCFHGSDAHAIVKLFRPDEERYCWIKSDPTFEGLRQTLCEPESRVFIGRTRPQPSNLSMVIERVRIAHHGGWFDDTCLELNSGLVAIIGEKGSGKTAIADLIAFAAGSPIDPRSQSSFVVKGRLHLSGVVVELEWASGAKSDGTLTDRPYATAKPLVRYLSQDFVERLCTGDHRGVELQNAIEEVIFSHLDERHREGYSSFTELRSAREAASQAKQDALRGQIASLNREIDRLHNNVDQRASKIADRDQIRNQIVELNKQLPSVTLAEDEAVLRELADVTKRIRTFDDTIASKIKQKRRLESFLDSYAELRRTVGVDVDEIIDHAGLRELTSDAELDGLRPTWNPCATEFVERMILALGKEIATLQGDGQDGEDSTIENLRTMSLHASKLKDSLTEDEFNKKRLLELQRQIGSHEATILRLTRELEELDTKTVAMLAHRMAERSDLYIRYFSALSEDEKGLQELYLPMKTQMSRFGSGMKFELSSGFDVDHEQWFDRSSRFFDGRKVQANGRRDEVEKFVIDTMVPAWSSGDVARVAAAVSALHTLVDPVGFMKSCAAPSLKMVDLLDWIFSTDHVRATYKIRYDGAALEHLSPGTRGIALLVLYLLMDEDDRRPLIIDQPEGNLDSSSVYEQLVPYIRSAKKNRQIVLVTHNPNLVVATDAEQIVVAIAERVAGQPYPRIQYFPGSLEHVAGRLGSFGTRQAVCTVLEGGGRAFREREERYALGAR